MGKGHTTKKHHVKFRSLYKHKPINQKWIRTITLVSFTISAILGYFSIVFMEIVSLAGAVAILLAIIGAGVFFDLLGISVTAADETPFHSMAASRIPGARESILLIRNAGVVANFFNDVIGDIAGIISGSASAAIVLKLHLEGNRNSIVPGILLTSLIAAMTVGGKGLGKEIAMRNSNSLVYKMGQVMHYGKKLTGRSF
ncbi:hypothetical protein [Anaerotalea alkaliphila]|uniref:CNNM transmembrane domain-containing protein n=1 Tax=Anaerotalea alkaliphila TaxID=2662126 RepID=A0A7X5HT94_9FIRM|nr:hypothetical protein [Anaerotalea alkaliphila]NDL66260.1 hypothetical protein [Anaerotalea alkaliphila]